EVGVLQCIQNGLGHGSGVGVRVGGQDRSSQDGGNTGSGVGVVLEVTGVLGNLVGHEGRGEQCLILFAFNHYGIAVLIHQETCTGYFHGLVSGRGTLLSQSCAGGVGGGQSLAQRCTGNIGGAQQGLDLGVGLPTGSQGRGRSEE